MESLRNLLYLEKGQWPLEVPRHPTMKVYAGGGSPQGIFLFLPGGRLERESRPLTHLSFDTSFVSAKGTFTGFLTAAHPHPTLPESYIPYML